MADSFFLEGSAPALPKIFKHIGEMCPPILSACFSRLRFRRHRLRVGGQVMGKKRRGLFPTAVIPLNDRRMTKSHITLYALRITHYASRNLHHDLSALLSKETGA
ncbi:hypothetical protein Q2T83_11550 [Fervidibacter sacchari]|uniref:Uncharacterized protein n=1 Tax=Candidatus Fervidibacter sacchari TaxID=1448929 RepID=A0ABT2ESZ3_9BACT|nr:hypothetical protein [Candidatus Fervidibacter sacchari]MCS3921027.1 hypothetical protein [Candidatus Fervidibacter sacchari]WKU14969.1 hypothetical protein Q2T83_11550 [Candidatus Fervidibacter sacchari]